MARSRIGSPGPSRASLDRFRDVLRAARENEVAEVLACRAEGGDRNSESSLLRVLERHMALDAGQRAIADIDRALARLDVGTYGNCEQCGSAISFGRLAAIPQTRFCARCPRRENEFWNEAPQSR